MPNVKEQSKAVGENTYIVPKLQQIVRSGFPSLRMTRGVAQHGREDWPASWQ
jgi:hypothetical protein